MLLHVIDSSDPEQRMKIKVVNEILNELVDDEMPILPIFNKCDSQKICFLLQKNHLSVTALDKASLVPVKEAIRINLPLITQP